MKITILNEQGMLGYLFSTQEDVLKVWILSPLEMFEITIGLSKLSVLPPLLKNLYPIESHSDFLGTF